MKERVKKLPKQAQGKSEEVVGHRAAGPSRGRAGRSGREALAHSVGSFPGRAWPLEPGSGCGSGPDLQKDLRHLPPLGLGFLSCK